MPLVHGGGAFCSGRSSDFPPFGLYQRPSHPEKIGQWCATLLKGFPCRVNQQGWGYSGGPVPEFHGVPYYSHTSTRTGFI